MFRTNTIYCLSAILSLLPLAAWAQCPTPPADQSIACGASASMTAATAYTVYSVVSSSCTPVPITGTNAFPTACDDCVTGQIPLGFNFNFYGTTYNSAVISSNGILGFGPFTYTSYTPFNIPALGTPNNYIAGLFMDIDIRNGGTITYATIGTAPNRQFVVYYNNVAPFGTGSTGRATFQIVLHENGSFRVIISQFTADWNASTSGGNATSGAENADGTLAFPVPGRNNTDFRGITAGQQDCHIFNPAVCTFLRWQQGATTLTTNPTLTVSPSATTTYTAYWNCGGNICTGNSTVTVPPAPSATGVTICQGGSGSLTGASCGVVGPTTAQGATFNSGNLTTSSPTWNRAFSGTTCSQSTTPGFYYHVYPFTVSTAGSYTFDGCGAADLYGHLFQNAFDPVTPCAVAGNFIVGNDDSNPTAGCGADPRLTATLSPGVTYYIVTSTFSSGTTSNFSWTFSGPAGATITQGTGGTLQWYTAATGGSPIGTGSPFNPVGVAGSPLSNTNTAGTTIFYAACSNAPSCRTAVNFVIQAAPTFSTHPADQTVCGGTTTTFSATVSGGSTFQWEFRASSTGTWGNISSTVGNAPYYLSASGTTTTTLNYQAFNSTAGSGAQVRLRATSAAGCVSFSNPATITINANFTDAGTIGANQTSCGPFDPATLTNTTAPSGGGGGTTQYQWQSSPNGTTWTDIAGATASTYNPPVTTTTIYYRRGARRSPCTAYIYTTSVVMTVNPVPTASVTGTNTICAGQSSTFTASGGNTYAWNTGANTAAITVSTAGTYTVTATSTAGCTATASRTLTVNALPTPSVAGTNTICAGQSSTFTASGGNTYAWNTGANTAAITVSTAGTYTVTATSTAGCTATAGRTLSVNALPTVAITGGTAVCENSSINLTATGASTYVWNNGLGTGATHTVNPPSTTTYNVTGTDANGCTGTASQVLTVNSISTQPVVTPMTTVFCPNTTVPLSVSGGTAGTGAQLQWYTGPNGSGTNVGTGSSISVIPVSTTTYYVRYEGLCNTTTDEVVTVNTKYFVYGLNGATTNTYCTDNDGWHHFYSGDEILLSILGDLTGGNPQITIFDNGTYYQESQGPNTPASCVNGFTPGEERFEMQRAWDVAFNGTPAGTYQVRFYHRPAERAAIEAAAAAWMAAYPACGYTYKYAYPNGFYWFKNAAGAYAPPQYDGLHLFGPTGSAAGINYVQLAGVTSFSGGSGAIILVPDPILSVDLLSFQGEALATHNHLFWTVDNEYQTGTYQVERSQDGQNFQAIGEVAARNLSSLDRYSFDDHQAPNGLSYYRLRILDWNGQASFSNIVVLSREQASNTGHRFFPNPSKGELVYEFENSQAGDYNLEVLDILGRRLQSSEGSASIGQNQVQINLQDYPAGTYLIRAQHADGRVHIERIIRAEP